MSRVIERLRELGASSIAQVPSAAVGTRLLAAFQERTRGDLRSPRHTRWRVISIAAAVLIAATGTLLMELRRSAPLPGRPLSASAPPVDDTMSEFVPVPDAALLPSLESASIVRYELPIAALPAYGIGILPGSSRPAVRADLLIGQDGHPRAIRLIPEIPLPRSTP